MHPNRHIQDGHPPELAPEQALEPDASDPLVLAPEQALEPDASDPLVLAPEQALEPAAIDPMALSPVQALERLASTAGVLFIGVRHHSPVCAAAVPTLLDRFQPERVLIELPAELEPWLPWLGHPDTVAPIALAAARGDGSSMGFYPFADFSPELAAVRWAVARGVPVEAFDRPYALAGIDDHEVDDDASPPPFNGPPEEIEASPAEIDPEKLRNDVSPAGIDVVTSENDVSAAGIDVVTGGNDVSAAGIDVVTGGNDVSPAGIDIVTSENDVSAAGIGIVTAQPSDRPSRVLDALLDQAGATDTEALWDLMVEARAFGADAEAVRRAGLLVGWALRLDATAHGSIPREDRLREAWMRRRLAADGRRTAVVAGAFHIPALLSARTVSPRAAGPIESDRASATAVITSLIPYSFELLDSRSGYPAGIRDPMWQQRVWQAAHDRQAPGPVPRTSATDVGDPALAPDAQPLLDTVAADAIVAICRQLRADGHPAGTADALEALRMAVDLAHLRDLPGPGRRELLEALEASLGQGEPLGRGRALARALDQVLVGRRRGALADGTPRSGLLPRVIAQLEALDLPGPGTESRKPASIRLDPLRSELDRRRHVALQQLAVCHVPYATLEPGAAAGGLETLTRAWSVQWTPGTEAALAVAGLRGVTLEQAATSVLRAEEARATAEDRLSARARLELLEAAAECGLEALVRAYLDDLAGTFVVEAALQELVDAVLLLERLARGHVPGLPAGRSDGRGSDPEASQHASVREETVADALRRTEGHREMLLAAAVAALEGLGGSTRVEDARALLELVRLYQQGEAAGAARLAWVLDGMVEEGAPLMQGAAGAARVLLERELAAAFGARMGSWVDAATTPAADRTLAERLQGALTVASPLFGASPDLQGGLLERVEALDDPGFLARLPALRHGFDALSPAARARLLRALEARLDPEGTGRGGARAFELEHDPALLARWAAADRAGRAAVARLGFVPVAAAAPDPGISEEAPTDRTAAPPPGEAGAPAERPVDPSPGQAGAARERNDAIAALDRWRLILGRERDRLDARGRRLSAALDELYGDGHGEGSRASLGDGGGVEAAFPTVREWAGELEALFGAGAREEVLGRAAEQGRGAAVLALDEEAVTPSIELLEAVLALKGGLPESQLSRLRRLVQRIVDSLVDALARRVRPALTGLALPRTSRRPVGPLDLRRTVAANLHTARESDGVVRLAPDRLLFRTRARRALDWHLVLVVDVSGSMEASTLYAAMMAAILSALPALSVSFLAFSTEVIDLSSQVSDPLGLLLEVRVGGGTDIGKALRYARGLVRVPARTMVVLVSDLEEGGAPGVLLREVRELVTMGARPLGLAALDERGRARFNRPLAERMVEAGMPVAALTPLELARWVGEQIR